MQLIYTKKAKRKTGAFLCFIILGFMLIYIAASLVDQNNPETARAMAEVNKYEVRAGLLMDTISEVGVCSPERAVEVWGSGLMKRSGALQYAVMTKKLRDEYAKQLSQKFPNWVTGMSSPWVESVEIVKKEKISNNHYKFSLKVSTATSTGPFKDYKATLWIAQEEDFWRITKIDTDQGLYPYTGYRPS
ncbi:MAG: hypothetical protein K0R90_1788 [Oscillospiraceae bacterium]|jgi:hypothetical protein|nr:hypothetical protein [Oscillospiraceae bacterium]